MDAQTVREFVGDIEQESERLARITENLLRLTRLDSGMLPEAQRVDLSPVMARVVRMLRLVAEEKQVDLSYEIRREGQTLASEDEIHEIIYNLTENAIKYNRPAGVGKVRAQALLKTFKSVKAIREADIFALERVLPKDAAASVYLHFHGETGEKEEKM